MYAAIYSNKIPISVDEAYNYLEISSKGPIYSVTQYPLPNNHVFFSFLQSIFISKNFLEINPNFLRLVNITLATLLLYFVTLLYLKSLSQKYYILPLIIFILIFISPYTTPYFIISRGYLLASLLLILGIYLIIFNKLYEATMAFILAGYTVLTYIYPIPFIYLFLFIFYKKKRRVLTKTGLIFLIGILILYFPILKDILHQSKYLVTFDTFIEFLVELWYSISNFSYINLGKFYNIIYFVLYLLSLCFNRRIKSKSLRLFLQLLNISILGYLVVSFLLKFLNLSSPPLIRTSFFIPLFIVINIFFTATYAKINKYTKLFIFIILLFNSFIGFEFFLNRLPLNSTKTYPAFALEYFPLTEKDIQYLKQKKLKSLTQLSESDYYVLTYYSNIYDIPIKYINYPKPNTEVSIVNINESLNFASKIDGIKPNTKIKIFISPTSHLYIFKRIYQIIRLKTYDIFFVSREPKIIYQIYLADLTYSEFLKIYRDGYEELAIKTLARAENYMTLAISDARVYFSFGNQSEQLVAKLYSSAILHLEIVKEVLNMNKSTNDQQLNKFYEIIKNNINSILSLG